MQEAGLEAENQRQRQGELGAGGTETGEAMTHPNDIPKGPARQFSVQFTKPQYLQPTKFRWIAKIDEPDFSDEAYGDTPEEALSELIRRHGWFNLGESVI